MSDAELLERERPATPSPEPGVTNAPPLGETTTPQRRQTTLEWADRELEEIDALVAGAYFRTALGLALATLERLPATQGQPELAHRVARLEVLAATAQLALGRRVQALEHLGRALAADPALELEAASTSPRIVDLLGEARRRREASR